jgi:hypothetical protein
MSKLLSAPDYNPEGLDFFGQLIGLIGQLIGGRNVSRTVKYLQVFKTKEGSFFIHYNK